MKDIIFTFKGYSLSLGEGEVNFNFALNKGSEVIDFREKISFPPIAKEIPQEVIKPILNNLMLILGISYWKLYCPKVIIVENNFLTKEQAEFWNIVYTKGLGEFFYKNNIDFRGLISFPFIEKNNSLPISYPRKERSLLLLGGGKDSIVTAELLKEQNKNFDLLTVGSSQIQEEVSKIIEKKTIIVKRELDPKLFELNKKENVYNGHIPISVIYAFMGLLASTLYDYSSVVVGNEKSANYGNVEYLGEIINHQWSKSEEFEKLFSDYVKKFITKDISYSSVLRDLDELEVTKKFVNYPKYFKTFSSCNRNFKINKPFDSAQGLRWCGECPKCLFVFISLAAFIPKKEVLNIFGENLFEDKNLIPLFEELLGVRNFKPFECVGTPLEVKEALGKILEKGEYNDAILVKHFKSL